MKKDEKPTQPADQSEELSNLDNFIKKKEIQNNALKVLIDKVNSSVEETTKNNTLTKK